MRRRTAKAVAALREEVARLEAEARPLRELQQLVELTEGRFARIEASEREAGVPAGLRTSAFLREHGLSWLLPDHPRR